MRQELLTILFIRSSYKIRKIHLPFIYYKLIKFLVFLFLLFFIALAVTVIVVKRQNTQLKQQLVRNEEQYKILYSEPIKYKGPETPPKQVSENTDELATPPAFTPIDSNLVSIQDLQIIKVDDNNISITFKLTNTQRGSSPQQGYLIVGAFPEPLQAQAGVLFPQAVKIDQGFNAVNISQGDSFSIKYLKNITITMFSTNASQLENLMIIIYSKNGNIIYRKAERINEN